MGILRPDRPPPVSLRARRVTRVLLLLFGTSLGGCAALADDARAGVRPNVSRLSLFEQPWRWIDERGRSTSFGYFRGQALVVSAIYTSCRTTCPRTLHKLRRLYAEQSKREAGPHPQFVLVTLDPTEDTPERLRRFKAEEHLPDSWRLFSGSLSVTRAFDDALDIHVLDDGAHRRHDSRIVIFDHSGLPERTFAGWSLDTEVPLF